MRTEQGSNKPAAIAAVSDGSNPDHEVAAASHSGNTADANASVADAGASSSSGTAASEGASGTRIVGDAASSDDAGAEAGSGSSAALLSPREQELLAQEVTKAMQQCSSSLASCRDKLVSGAAAAHQGRADSSGSSSSGAGYPAATLLMQSLADIKQAANAWDAGE
jgi:hypothetical protein